MGECNEEDLTILVLDAMRKAHNVDGNIITFNIALKRLAKTHNYLSCEGIIIGMLQNGVEPSVVSYTTAIAACASKDDKQPAIAYQWLQRMRSRQVNPNVLTYNTALAACLDGKLESTELASKMAAEMPADERQQLKSSAGEVEEDEYKTVIPDASTRELARELLQQLEQNCEAGEIEKTVATETIAVPLQNLADFALSDEIEKAKESLEGVHRTAEV